MSVYLLLPNDAIGLLYYQGPRLFRWPIAEVIHLYATTHHRKPGSLVPGDNALAGIYHGLLDIVLELDLQHAGQVSLNLRGEEIRYSSPAGERQSSTGNKP